MTTQRETSGHDVALYGITGALGREVLAALEVEHEGIGRFFPVANNRSAGQQIRWAGATTSVMGPLDVDVTAVDFAILSVPYEAAAKEAPRLLDAGARLIDLSAALALPPLPRALTNPAPLVWPSLSSFKSVDLDVETALALPSATASTLAPLVDALTAAAALSALPALVSIDVTALLSASAAGRGGVEALSRQAVGLLNYRPVLDPRPFPAVLAFNTIAPPPDEVALFADRTGAELGRLVPAASGLPVDAMPIWVPSFSGLTLSLTLVFAGPVDPETLRKVIGAHPDLAFDMPLDDAEDEDDEPADIEDEDGAPVDEVAPPTRPDTLHLRGVLERGDVRVSTPLVSRSTVRLVLMADPIERTALAVSTLLTRWMAALDAE